MYHLLKTKKNIQKFKEQEIHGIFIKTDKIKLTFTWSLHTYGDFKYLPKKKQLLTLKVFNFFDEMSSDGCIIQNQRPLNSASQELAEELHKLIIRKFEKRKLH